MALIDLNNKVAIVTGAAGGLGKAFSDKLLSKGAKVCVCDIRMDKCTEVVEELEKTYGTGKVLGVHVDVTKKESYKAAFEECKQVFGRVDIVVNNAGICNEKRERQTFDINVFGVFTGTEMAMAEMKEAGTKGVIVNVGSQYGMLVTPSIPYYGASKAAVIDYSRSMGHAFHYEQTGIRVLCICPGLAQTPILLDAWGTATNEWYMKKTKELIETIPKQRPEDVANGLLKIIEEAESGAVAVIEHGRELYYVPPTPEVINPTWPQ